MHPDLPQLPAGVDSAVALIGERWALLVLSALMLGPLRFSHLRKLLPAISANVLTQRLHELQERGLVERVELPPPASVQVYRASAWALKARPIIEELGRWANTRGRPRDHRAVAPTCANEFSEG
jgi:DNA-binding HxlR family transcriptional regulator